LGLEGFKTPLAVLAEPGLQGGDPEFPAAIVGKVMLRLGLLAEVVILGPFRLSQDWADDLEALEGDFFSDLFFHGLFSSWARFSVTEDRLPLQIARE
jgi:hypothetical protein